MLLTYLHGGDLPLTFWLLVGLLSVVAFAAFVAILTAIHRRAERRTTSASESTPDTEVPSD